MRAVTEPVLAPAPTVEQREDTAQRMYDEVALYLVFAAHRGDAEGIAQLLHGLTLDDFRALAVVLARLVTLPLRCRDDGTIDGDAIELAIFGVPTPLSDRELAVACQRMAVEGAPVGRIASTLGMGRDAVKAAVSSLPLGELQRAYQERGQG